MRRHPIQWAGILALIVGMTGFGTSHQAGRAGGTSAAQEGTRYAGEHGLWISLHGDSVTVRWLTSGRSPGRLEAVADGRTVREATTPKSRGHRVALPRPEARRLRLRYGADGGRIHETEIRLEEPDPDCSRAEGIVEGVDSLYVVGDVHGQYERLVRLLRNAGLVDGDARWAGGRSHLVFLGDLMDRGPDVRRTLWFAYRLQEQAARAGGRVHMVLGNHEVMVLTGDHRYAAPKEQLLARLHGVPYRELYHPDRSVLGRWIASWPAALKVDRILLAHGGIGPAYGGWSVEALNDSARAWMAEPLFRYFADTTVAVEPMDSAAVARRLRFFFEEPSPLWFRGYARTDTLGEVLRETLEHHDARLHAIAHTPVPEIRHNYGDSVALVDLREPASELLLLARSGDGYRRWAFPMEGEARKVPPERR